MKKAPPIFVLFLVIFSVFQPELKAQKEIPVYSFDQIKHYFEAGDRDSLYVINFWATWCKPCVDELPYLLAAEKTYAKEKVRFIFISLDFPSTIEKRLKPFLKKKAMHSEVWVLDDPDSNSWIPKVGENWSGAIPGTLLISKNYRAFMEKTFHSEEVFKAEIDKALSKSIFKN